MAKDVYAKEVEYLTKHPNEIYTAWYYGEFHSPLFDACSAVRGETRTRQGFTLSPSCGCLTQIKACDTSCDMFWHAATAALTKAIRADKALPNHPRLIRVKHLSRFAYWQRKLDKLFKTRPAPKAPARAKS